MIPDMTWAKCPECPPGDRLKYIPDGDEICLSCQGVDLDPADEGDEDEAEHETPGEAYSDDELQQMMYLRLDEAVGDLDMDEDALRNLPEEADVDADEIVEQLETNGGENDGEQ